MKKVVFPFRIWTAVVCVVMAGMWLSKESVAGVITFGSGGNAFDMTFVPIGNANNANDTTGNPNPAGKVEYAYQMGKFEVSRDMVSKATAAGGPGITMADLSTFGGNGVNRPATGVSWNEAARFVNWLNTSKGYRAAYNFTSGGVNDNISLWNIGDGFALGGSSENLFRHKDAHFWLPSMDEWYKAAYYDPNANSAAGGYWNFPNGSDTAPMAVASGMASNTAVYNQTFFQGSADIMSALRVHACQLAFHKPFICGIEFNFVQQEMSPASGAASALRYLVFAPASSRKQLASFLTHDRVDSFPKNQRFMFGQRGGACCGFLDRAFRGTTRFSSAPGLMPVGE